MKRIEQRLEGIPFDEFYGYVKSQNLTEGVKEVFRESMGRYV